ncbi:alpha/beta-hydrolase [Aaosphaeria arxii CBS 175.79]|uniref:Alpha/beta-hydrolase n=1 Tax=Aaosphaeria arxii CBS 175.79 TaxID=1450172 RepID=A0A6A5XGZ4_9PLEO|nr:alpha/beta-hydrolase [Aaosphaeria arxii CBS 175.79]KAF2012107.1 alpha/beta-hydrolase [Aaosphaeria arxii CBS 175.79]
MTAWSKQPFKALYGVFFIVKLIGLIPLSLLRYSPKWSRPVPGWSLKICVVNVVARELFRYYTQTRSNGVAGVESGHRRAKERFALVEPADASLYSGVLASGTSKPAAVGGLWFPSPIPQSEREGEAAPSLRDEKVVLHFAGGAFVLAFGTEENGQDISNIMTRHLKATRTFLAQYRVSSDSQTRFPSAIQDLVTSYHYILSLGIPPANIILSGDSAAGNLILALLRHLSSNPSPHLPPPGGAMLWSPWVHVTPTAGADYTQCRNSAHDLLIPSLLQWGADAYLPEPGKTPPSDVLPFISPLHHAFATTVPLFVHAGGGEAFFDQVNEFTVEMERVQGNRVRFCSTETAPHNLLLAYRGLGLEGEMEVAAESARKFFEGED